MYQVNGSSYGDNAYVHALNEAKRKAKEKGYFSGSASAENSHQAPAAPAQPVVPAAPVQRYSNPEVQKFLAALPISLPVDEPTHALMSKVIFAIGRENRSLARQIDCELIGRLAVQFAMRQLDQSDFSKNAFADIAAVVNVDRECRQILSSSVDFSEKKHRERFENLEYQIRQTFQVDFVKARVAILRWSLDLFESRVQGNPALAHDLLMYTSK